MSQPLFASRFSNGRVPSKTEMDTAEVTLERAQGERASAAATVKEAQATLSSDRTNLSKERPLVPRRGEAGAIGEGDREAAAAR